MCELEPVIGLGERKRVIGLCEPKRIGLCERKRVIGLYERKRIGLCGRKHVTSLSELERSGHLTCGWHHYYQGHPLESDPPPLTLVLNPLGSGRTSPPF